MWRTRLRLGLGLGVVKGKTEKRQNRSEKKVGNPGGLLSRVRGGSG